MYNKIIIATLVSLFLISTSHACQYICQNCLITKIEPHATGSTTVYFNTTTNDNPDGCGIVSRALIDVNSVGAKQMLAGMYSAFLTGRTLEAVRTCGCADEWGTNYPALGWFQIK